MKKVLTTIIAIICIATSGYGQSAPCTYSRPDIYSYTSAERLQLRNLIKTYLNTVIDGSFASGPQRYPLVYMHTMHSGMIHGTGTKAFTTWHRYYIQGLENWLMDNGYSKYVPLPYWDPTTTIPNEFFNSLAPGSAQLDAGFPDNANQNITPPSRTNFIPSASCSTHSSDNNFSNDLEVTYHNPIHGAIGGGGGSMTSITTAPGSAIFWLYHAWIDDMWFCYQRNCDALFQDQYVREDVNDNGTEPSSATVTWNSPDIWVRNTNDGFQNKSSEDITQYPGKIAYVYVRVWNRGTRPNDDGTGTVTAYWAKGNTALAWPAPWDGSTTITCASTARPLGGMISSQPLRRVNENFNDFTETGSPLEKDYYIYEFSWTIPDPDWYAPCFPDPNDQRHFCLLARLDDGNPTTPINDLYSDLHNFNNFAMKNIAIIGDGAMAPKHSGVLWGNVSASLMHKVCLGVTFPNVTYASLLDRARMKVTLDPISRNEWMAAGHVGENITFNDAGDIFVTRDNARICGFGTLRPNTIRTLDVSVDAIDGGSVTGEYEFDVTQYQDETTIVGGEHYVVNRTDGVYDQPDGRMEGRAVNPGSVTLNSSYTIYPNPTSNTFQITASDGNYNIEVKIYDNLGRCVKTLGNITKSTMFASDDLPAGIYIVKITNKDSKATYTQKLTLQK